jgi:hypothetical protein
MILFHIIVASLSLIFTGYVFFRPSTSKLHVAYGLVAMTLFTGFYLVLSKPAHLTQTCMEGLVYLGVVSFGIVSARNKLARVLNK